jgi:branched-chain amino acid aminotransferase
MSMLITVNGEVRSPEEATVSVFDRGFLYGDSVYEVVRTYGGRPFAVLPHLARLRASARQIHLEIPVPDEVLVDEIERSLEAAGNEESYARLIVTRGAGPIELHPGRSTEPARILIVQPLDEITEDAWRRGLHIAIVHRRRNDPSALDPAAKTGNYLNNVLAIVEARKRGADDAVLLNREGHITEGTTANVFVVKDGRVRTPPMASGILGGITRRTVLDLIEKEGVEARLYPEDLRDADEAFFTSTTRGVLPVTIVDGEPVGTGAPGPATRALHERFEAHVRSELGLDGSGAGRN